VVLRSLALGARVRIHSLRTGAWRPMVERVDDAGLLCVVDHARGSIVAGAHRNYSVEVFDGTTEQPVGAGVTTLVVKPAHAAPSRDADVTLELLDIERDVVRVGTSAKSSVVTMVATDDEMRYLDASLELAS
jgi:hypothetical protein